MRTRTVVAAVSGAAMLSALALPAVAQADVRTSGRTITGSTSKSHVRALDEVGEDVISHGVVNGGKDIVLGTTTKASVGITYTVTSPNGFAGSWVALWQGTAVTETGIKGELDAPSDSVCTATSTATVYTCKATLPIDAYKDMYKNGAAGTWKLIAFTFDSDGVAKAYNDTADTVKIKHIAKVTVNATPEPVKKGATITVAGALTVANWTTHKYAGYGKQKVALQFRKAGTTSYVNVKGITAGSTGSLKTTVKAAQDGYFRFNFAGSPTAGPAAVAGDYVDVK
ncbi:hypothetical protein ACFWVC_09635 [Streptomyces sp. NPDC058691]|uniref:hypothetical protein n=1 Tax=Streptomyces sp. NPDC058691 TaxID=3346601 RepID=UPI0036503C51